jgi:hypothetical protein
MKHAAQWFLPAVLAALLIPAFAAFPERAEARPRHGETILVLPRGHRPVVVKNVTYYYHDGVYYRRAPRGWVVVAPPYGAVVPAIPRTRRVVLVKGATYYVDNDVYYRPVVVAGQPQYEVAQVPVQPPVTQGPYCREAQLTIIVGGREERAITTACREPDGTWRLRP